MPNPRAQRQLTLDRVVSDLKSFAEPAQAMGDMMAGALRGSFAATSGLGGDISEIGRAVAPDTMQSVFGRRVMPTTEEMNKMLPSAVPQNASASRKHTAETFGALGEFMPTPMSGTAAKALTYGLGRGAGALTRGAGKMVNDAMVYNQGPLAQGSLSFLAPRTATMNVVKPEGGNWTGGELMNSVDRSLNRLTTPTVVNQTPAERIPLHERALLDPAINDDGRAIIQRHLDTTKKEAALDKWVTQNLGNYVKKQMATPNDPVRLMFESRVQEVESKFAKDMERANRTRERAQQEADPRRQANLTREADRLASEAEFDRDFSMKHITHMPANEVEESAIYVSDRDMRGQREKAGFNPEGEAKSMPAKAWENLSDEAIETRKAGDIQKAMAVMPEAQKVTGQLLEKQLEIDQKFRKYLEDKNVLKPDELESVMDKMSTRDKAHIIGEGEEYAQLQNKQASLQGALSGNDFVTGEQNPWISKLDPESTLYSGDIYNLGFDHVVDILKQDVMAGRIRPEQLNKITVDQAIKRTAEFDMEQAKKMQETAIKNTEGMPVYKDYGDEGYKWIELAPAKEKKVYTAETLPEGFTLEKNADGFYNVRNFNVGMTPTTDSYSRNPEESIKKFNDWVKNKNHDLELQRALTYEGDTMGHCVGGYCPDVLEGRSRIYSLRDKRGEPHVTVEVRPNQHLDYNDWFDTQTEEVQNRIAQRRLEDKNHDIYEGPEYLADRAALPPKIIQIKGKQNQAPKEQYLPYVQDFVRSGQYSDVGDLRNTGLMDVKYMTNPETYKLYLERGLSVPKYATEKELEQLHNEYLRLAEPNNYKPPETGMKKGGKVSISDNCDCQHMEVMDKHMAGGGALSKAAIEALERMKALKPEFQARTNLLNKYKAETVGLPYNEVKPFQMTNEQIREEMDRMAKSQKLVNTIKSGEQMLNHIVATDPAKEALKNDKMTNYIKSRKFSEKTIEPSKLPSIDDIYAIENDLYGRVLMPDEYKVKDYKDRIKAGSMPPAIVMDEFGNILDGQHRAIAAREANVPIKAYVPEQSKAGGGAIKKLAKVITSSSDELALPSKLPRAKPRTKEDLRPLAQEMAEATRGDFYRPNPAKSINPAGKSFDQWKMEQGLVHDIRPTAQHQAIPRSDIEKQKGMVKMGISGDTSVAEQVLHEAGPYTLDIPSPQHGGALYGLGKEGAWASNNPIAANVQKRINEISEAYGGAPILGQYMQMGKLGTDFALHFADANLRAIDLSRMTPSQIEAVNDLIRKGSPKSGARPSFPGIQDKDSAYLHFAVDPELRKHFNAIMQKPTYTEPLGLPDGRIVHHAITEPELRNLPVTTTGFSQMELQPGFDPESLLLSAHPTYSHVIPHKPNTGLTRTQVHLPAQVDFPDVHEYVTQTGPKIYRPEDLTRVYQTSTPRQIVDQQHIDEIKMFEDLMKQYGGKKKGGAIKKVAEGGEITGDDLIIEERPL